MMDHDIVQCAPDCTLSAGTRPVFREPVSRVSGNVQLAPDDAVRPGCVQSFVPSSELEPAEVEPTLAQILHNFPELLFRERVRRWCKQSDGRRVAEVSLPEAAGERIAFYKCIERSGPIKRLLAPFRRSTVRHAWEIGHAFLRDGIATPEPLDFVDSGTAAQGRQYLLTAAIPDSVTLATFCSVHAPQFSADEFQVWLRGSLQSLADQVRRMHDCRYDHRDLKFDNILVSIISPRRTWFLDLDAVRRWPRLPAWSGRSSSRGLPFWRAVQNIARLNVSALLLPMFRHTDRLRFLAIYLGSDFRAEWKWWWRNIARRSQQKQRQNHRRGRPLT